MPKKITFEHNFFENGINGLLGYLNSAFKPFGKYVGQTFPIGIANTGDEKYLFDMIYEKHIYELSPRWTLSIAGVNTLAEQNTNPHVYGFFFAKNEEGDKQEYTSKVQRKTVQITFSTEVIFDNVFQYFQFVEIYLTLTSIRHAYAFYHAGKRQIAVFELPEITDDAYNTTFGMSSDKRQHKLQLSFILDLQFPAFQMYGIPGSNWEGNNGYVDANRNHALRIASGNDGVNDGGNENPKGGKNEIPDGSAGNGTNPDGTEQNGPILNAELMIAIIHNMHVDDPKKEGIISTMIVTKNPNDEKKKY